MVNRTRPTGDPADYKPFCFDDGCVAPLAAYGSDYVYRCTSSMNGEDGFTNSDPANAERRVAQIYAKLAKGRSRIVMNKTFHVEGCETLIVAYGASARASRVVVEEMRAAGKKVGLFQIHHHVAVPGAEIAEAARNVKSVIVPEMNYDGSG